MWRSWAVVLAWEPVHDESGLDRYSSVKIPVREDTDLFCNLWRIELFSTILTLFARK
jgi:hypothetical protein